VRRRLAGLAISLYPLAFRHRYGDEIEALLDQAPVRTRTLIDLLQSAIVAHLRPGDAADAVPVDARLRASVSGVLVCWAIFVAAGLAFYKTTEDAPFASVGDIHPALGIAHSAIQVLAALASIAVVAGALPLAVATLEHARRERGLRVAAGIGGLAVVGFAALTALVVLIAHGERGHGTTTLEQVAFVTWAGAAIVYGAVFLIAARRVTLTVPVARQWLVFTLGCGAVVAAVMIAIALATAAYGLALHLDASRLAASANGPFGSPHVEVSVVAQAAVMAAAGALATVTTYRGWRALWRSR
jgi:hypothetical protein